MKKAMRDVEQMRLRMQRASERIELDGIPTEGTLIKKKKSKKKPTSSATQEDGDSLQPADLKKKRKEKKERKGKIEHTRKELQTGTIGPASEPS